MARRVFFSFHFERDYWRAGQVRNHWLTKSDRESAGYWDAGDWEKVKREGDDAIKRWINNGLNGASVTAVLIGAETSTRRWVDYEIEQSANKGMGLLGVYIHRKKDKYGFTDIQGNNPFNNWQHTYPDGSKRLFSEIYKTYDWILDSGYENFGSWVDHAARNAGK